MNEEELEDGVRWVQTTVHFERTLLARDEIALRELQEMLRGTLVRELDALRQLPDRALARMGKLADDTDPPLIRKRLQALRHLSLLHTASIVSLVAYSCELENG